VRCSQCRWFRWGWEKGSSLSLCGVSLCGVSWHWQKVDGRRKACELAEAKGLPSLERKERVKDA